MRRIKYFTLKKFTTKYNGQSTLYLLRLMTGFAGGAFVLAAPAYTAETAEIRFI